MQKKKKKKEKQHNIIYKFSLETKTIFSEQINTENIWRLESYGPAVTHTVCAAVRIYSYTHSVHFSFKWNPLKMISGLLNGKHHLCINTITVLSSVLENKTSPVLFMQLLQLLFN